MTECNNFDIIGVFLSDYGLTGESIAIQIFSYLDFSSLKLQKDFQFVKHGINSWPQIERYGSKC